MSNDRCPFEEIIADRHTRRKGLWRDVIYPIFIQMRNAGWRIKTPNGKEGRMVFYHPEKGEYTTVNALYVHMTGNDPSVQTIHVMEELFGKKPPITKRHFWALNRIAEPLNGRTDIISERERWLEGFSCTLEPETV